MTPAQCRDARHLLGWSQERLAARSEITSLVIRVFETTGRVQRGMAGDTSEKRLAAICAALEAVGIEFTNGEAPGVRLRQLPDDPPA